MTTTTPSDKKATAHQPRRREPLPQIVGPIREYNRYDRPTGATYFECSGCGRQALHRSDMLHTDDCPHS